MGNFVWCCIVNVKGSRASQDEKMMKAAGCLQAGFGLVSNEDIIHELEKRGEINKVRVLCLILVR